MTKTRNQALLGGVSATALSLMIGMAAVPANAAGIEVTYSSGGIGSILAHGSVVDLEDIEAGQIVGGYGLNEGPVSAIINEGVVELEIDGTGSGSTSGTTVGNDISAQARGNVIETTVDLSYLLNTDVPVPMDGIAAIAAAENLDGAGVLSRVSASRITAEALTTDDDNVLSMNVIGNTIEAYTALNSASMIASGEVPTGYSSGLSGSAGFDFDSAAGAGSTLLASDASLAAGNVQLNIGVGAGQSVVYEDDEGVPVETGPSGAILADNRIELTIAPGDDAEDDQVVIASPTIQGNTMSATYRGNDADSLLLLGGDGAPTFEGSAVFANVQGNVNGGDGIAAQNIASTIEAQVLGDEDAINLLAGTLAVTANTISSSASGNDALNQIALDEGLNFDGDGSYEAGAPALPVTGSRIALDGAAGGVGAGLGILSSQSNIDTETSALTQGASIIARIDQYEGDEAEGTGGLGIRGNNVTATASGNDVENRLIGANAANSFEGSAAIASAQVNEGSETGASVTGTTILGSVGDGGATAFGGSSASVRGNQVDASASGNASLNVLAIDAGTTIDLGDEMASVSLNPLADTQIVSAGASISNVQVNDAASDVTASNTGTTITVETDVDNYDGSSLSNRNNRVTANAGGNDSVNHIVLTGNDIAGGSAVANRQVQAADIQSTVSGAEVAIDADDEATGASLRLTGNLAAASATGNSVSNSQAIEGTTIVLSREGASGNDGAVNAGYVISSNQNLSGDVGATVTNSGSPFSVTVDDVDESSIRNSSNTIRASATGNASTFSQLDDDGNALAALRIDATTLGVAADGDDTYAPAAALVSVQTRELGADVSATVNGEANTRHSFLVDADGGVQGSSISASQNIVQAAARGNVATGNSMAVTGGNFTVAYSEDEGSIGGLGQIGLTPPTANAAFIVQNIQSGGEGTISATQNNVGALLSVDENVQGSTLRMHGNGFIAQASDNLSSNSLDIDGNTIQASGGVQNFQYAEGTVTARLGTEGADAVFGVNYSGGLSSVIWGDGSSIEAVLDSVNGELDVTLVPDQTITISANGLTTEQRNALATLLPSQFVYDSVENEFVASTSFSLSTTPFTGTISTDLSGFLSNFVLTGFETEGSPATPASPSVITSVGGDILDSTISIRNSEAIAWATSNQASNRATISGNQVLDGSGLVADDDVEEIGSELDTSNALALADYAVFNRQIQTGAASASAEAHGTYAIEADVEGAMVSEISESSLRVTGTIQEATARGNRAGNRLELSANGDGEDGDASTTLAILSDQVAQGGISAESHASIYAPVAASDSSVSLTNNSNRAQGTANTVTNEIAVSGTALGTNRTDPANGTVDPDAEQVSAAADYSILSNQIVGGQEINVEASTVVNNQEGYLTDSDHAISGSSIRFNRNRTVAEAQGNVGFNYIDVGGEEGATSVEAMSSLVSTQTSDADLTAEATTDVRLGLDNDVEGATIVSGSSISLSGNAATAISTANDADNVLIVLGSSIGTAATPDATGTVSTTVPLQVSASNTLNSAQVGTGDSIAESTLGVGLTLDGGEGSVALGDSSVRLSDNVSQAFATGNTASNGLQVTGDASVSSTSGLLNTQIYEGDVSAGADGDVRFSASVIGQGLSGSSARLTGNVVLADAASNDASNILNVYGANISGGSGDVASLESIVGGEGGILDPSQVFSASATNVLVSGQQSSGVVDAEASLTVHAAITASDDLDNPNPQGLSNATLRLSGNQAVAIGDGNRVSNALNIGSEDTANLAATGGISNTQHRSGAVSASVTADIGADVLSGGAAAANSSARVTGNLAGAEAAANRATNSLNVQAAAQYNTPSGEGASGSVATGTETATARAAFGVLNGQWNEASVTASATGGFGVALNGTTTGSSARVDGNRLVASASGNVADNHISLASVAGNSPTAAVTSAQINSGAIRAVVTGATVGALSDGGFSGSSVSVNGNGIVASATGNSVRNSIRSR